MKKIYTNLTKPEKEYNIGIVDIFIGGKKWAKIRIKTTFHQGGGGAVSLTSGHDEQVSASYLKKIQQ